jgi:hypothetical protein
MHWGRRRFVWARGRPPGLVDEAIWWRADDLWFWALQAGDLRSAAAERSTETVPAIGGRLASRHDVQLAAAT